jgi:competence CoiA-like predicted nuclease
LNDSATDKFEVSKKGQSLSLSELKSEIPKLVPHDEVLVPEKSQHSAQTQQNKILKSGSSLGDDDINRVMHNQTSFLHRCYINYMFRTQKLDPSGQVVLSFLIEPSGKVKDTKVVSSPIADEQLNHCLTDVINRANFKEFSAQAVFVQAYPIHLD